MGLNQLSGFPGVSGCHKNNDTDSVDNADAVDDDNACLGPMPHPLFFLQSPSDLMCKRIDQTVSQSKHLPTATVLNAFV